MNVPAQWRTSVLASHLHLARCLLQPGSLVDPSAAESLAPAARRVASALGAEPADGSLDDATWPAVLALAADDPPPAEFAQRWAGRDRRSVSRPSASLADTLRDFAAAAERAFPRLATELPLRVGPLREQWEARGPGLLNQAARITGIPLRSLAADALVLPPWLGGFGEACPPLDTPPPSDTLDAPRGGDGTVALEGVLINPHPQLPETVRLGWLLLRLAAADVLSELPIRPAPTFLAAVTIPPIVAAGQFVELIPAGDANPVATALALWLPAGIPPALVQSLSEQEVAPGMDWLEEATALAESYRDSA